MITTINLTLAPEVYRQMVAPFSGDVLILTFDPAIPVDRSVLMRYAKAIMNTYAGDVRVMVKAVGWGMGRMSVQDVERAEAEVARLMGEAVEQCGKDVSHG